MPVPIAVPPWGKYAISFEAEIKDFSTAFNWALHPDNSCEKSMGIASIKCVLPVFTWPLRDIAFLSITLIRLPNDGSNSLWVSNNAEIQIAVGITSILH